MFDLLNILLPTFTAIFVGFLIGKFSKINMAGIIDLIFYVGVPALGFTSMMDKKIVLADASKVWASAIIIMLGCGLVAWTIFRMSGKKHSGMFISVMMMNTVNIPFPILSQLFGKDGLSGAILFYIPNVIILYSLGIIILSRKNWKNGLKEMAKVPAIYASVLGLAFNLLSVPVPAVILTQMNFIGTMTVPLVLITLGAKLAVVKIKSLPTTFIASGIRLGVGLGLGFAAVAIFHLTGVLRSVVIFDSAMPAAVNTSLLAIKYDSEPDLVSSVVFVTTIASLVMIPFLILIIK